MNSAPVNILLVDDEPRNLVVLEAVLAPLGENLVRAHSGGEALRRVLETDFAAILLDVRMPTMDGLETAKLIRSRARSSTTPIIFVTASDGPGLPEDEAYELGAVDFLTKPISPNVLKAKVGFFAELYRKTEALRAAERTRADAALRASEERLRLVMANVHDHAIFTLDLTGNVADWNAGAERVFGYAAGEIVGKPGAVVFTAEDRAARRPEIEMDLCRSTGRAGNERWHLRKDGSRFFASGSMEALRHEGGSLAGYVTVVRDRTAEKRFQSLVDGQKQALELAVAGTPLVDVLDVLARTAEAQSDGGILASVLLMGDDGRTLRHGAAPSLPDAYNRAIDGVATGPAVGSCGTAAFTGREVVVTDVASDPLWKDFRALALEHGLRACWSTPIRSSSGAVLGTFALYYRVPKAPAPGDREVVGLLSNTAAVVIERHRESGQRRRAEEALLQTDARLNLLVSNVTDYAVIISDPEGTVLEWQGGAEAITGYSAAEAVGESCSVIFTPEDRASGQPEKERAKAAQDGRAEDVRWHLRKDGSRFFANGVMTALRDPAGTLIGFGKVFRDETVRKLAEARDRFLADLAASTQPLTEPDEVTAQTARLLCEHLGADRCAYAEVEDESVYVITGDHTRGVSSIVGRWPVAAFGAEHLRMMRADEPYVVYDADADPRIGPDDLAAYRATAISAVVCVPLLKNGRLTAAMAVHQAVPRRWTAEEVGLVRSVVARCWEARERSRAGRQLEASEAQLRLIADAMPALIAYVDADQRYRFVNRHYEAWFGLPPAEVVGRHLRDVVGEKAYELLRPYVERAIAGERFEFEAFPPYPTGPRHIHAAFVPRVEDGRVAGYYSLITDVTERARAAADLRASEERYRALLENLSDGFIVLDREYRLAYVNASAEQLNGLSREEVLGRTQWEAFPASVGTILEREFRRAMDERATVEFENHYAPWDRWFALKAYPAPEGGICVQYRDITAAKRAEVGLRTSEARFRTAVAATSEILWTNDAAGRMTADQPAWSEFTGQTPEQYIGYGWADALHPDDLGATVAAWEAAVTERRTFVWEHRLRRHDGVYRPFSVRALPVADPDGTIREWVGTHTDISDRKRVEERLRRVSLASRAIHASLSIDSIARIVTEEARALIGAHQAVVSLTTGDDWSQAVNAVSLSDKYAPFRSYAGKPDGSCIYAEVCRTNRPMRLTQAELERHPAWRAFGKHAKDHPLMRGWLAVPLIGHGGRNLGLVQLSDKEDGEFTAEDEAVLTQRASIASVGIENARLYESLKEASQRKDEFLATLAHELRNPLAPIRNGVTVLRMGKARDNTERLLGMMDRQLGQLVHLVDDLLDVSRVTSGKITLRTERFDLREVVDAAVETSRPLVEEARHQLDVRLPDGPLLLEGDKTRLAQVITNLLNNAAKYTPAGGRIKLAAERNGSEVVVRVADNGVGIPSEMLPKVFEVFTQVGRTIDRAQGGLGLGLALVHRLVEMHGGKVWAESAGVGQGSTFVVHLPLSPHAADRNGAVSRERSRATALARRILVVDDNVDAADSLAALLDLHGHRTETAHSGPEAVAKAKAFNPEVIFLDIGLPGMNGYEVAQALRAEPQTAGAVLVALTGWGTSNDQRHAANAGFDHHLTKPAEAEQVYELLGRLPTTRGSDSCT